MILGLARTSNHRLKYNTNTNLFNQAIIDGGKFKQPPTTNHETHSISKGILTDRSRARQNNNPEWINNADVRLDPDSIATVSVLIEPIGDSSGNNEMPSM